MAEEFVIYRNRTKIFFVNKKYKEKVDNDLAKIKMLGFGVYTSLMYMSTYVIDVSTTTMIKNRVPDADWPEQVFNEVFSGVSNATYI